MINNLITSTEQWIEGNGLLELKQLLYVIKFNGFRQNGLNK